MIVVLGDTLLDRDVDGDATRLSPDAPVPVIEERTQAARPGGAGLAAVLAARDGRDVTLITALAADDAGAELRAALHDAGVHVVDLGRAGTTVEKIRVRAAGRPLVRLDRGEAGRPGAVTPPARAALAQADAILVSDYGHGLTAEPSVRAALTGVASDLPLVWDPHPRGADPLPGVHLVTPNAVEAARLVPEPDADPDNPIAVAGERARALARRWGAVAVCVTLGARGALLAFADGTPLAVPAPMAAHGDPCGAGDRFASAAAGLLADGALASAAVRGAVEVASAFVAAGGVAALGPSDDAPDTPTPSPTTTATAHELARRVRAAGGTVVATGGCFDVLHAGHAQMLAAARALGDCLIVCLNADASVRRLKGPARPVVGECDRAALLQALGCVDAVAVFDEDVPTRVLQELRPHLFVKGGDYHAAELPEAQTLAAWGGRAVTVPYMPGRSTTAILEEVLIRDR
jgi:rfaE bifunctional protein nucleotidyltransferase chain/domain/rfaE bifunctional protein kinase chain/domain